MYGGKSKQHSSAPKTGQFPGRSLTPQLSIVIKLTVCSYINQQSFFCLWKRKEKALRLHLEHRGKHTVKKAHCLLLATGVLGKEETSLLLIPAPAQRTAHVDSSDNQNVTEETANIQSSHISGQARGLCETPVWQ